MQSNDERPLKSSKIQNFDEFPPDSLDSGIKAMESTESTIIEPVPVPIPRNERPLGGKGNYRTQPEETPNSESKHKNQFEEPPEEAIEEETGPLEKRIESKVWKTRTKALEEVITLIKANNSSLINYSAYVVKFISDAHPAAQEKGLEICQIIISKSPDILTPQSESITKSLIEKGIANAKASIKQLATTILLDFFAEQPENTENFIKGLQESLNNKNVKTQSAAIFSVNSLISSYGIKFIPFKVFIPAIEKFAANSNAGLRSEALNFYKECYKWVRELILPSIQQLKKPQQEELQKAFEEIKDYPNPTRFLKCKGSSASNQPNKKFDAYELADAKDLFSKYTHEWVEKVLEMKKWVDKKQALEQVNLEANYPKIAEKSPEILLEVAKPLINDPNVNVMTQALKLVGYLAKGQRRYFEQYAKQYFPIFLEKLKEKKTLIVQDVYTGLENLLYSINLDQVLEELKEAFEDKTPTLKINLLIWLQKIFSTMPVNALQKSVKTVGLESKKLTDESTASIRNESFKLLGILKDRFHDQLAPVIKDFPQAKLKKLEEFCENKTAEKPSDQAEVAESKPETFEEEEKKPIKKSETMAEPLKKNSANTQIKPKTLLKKSNSKSNLEAEIKTARNKPPSLDIKISNIGDKSKRLDFDSKYKWSVEEIRPDYLEKIKEQIKIGFSPDLSALMFHSDFKKQADAASHIFNIVKDEGPSLVDYIDLLFKWSWIELIQSSNTQIYKAILELNLLIVSKLESFEVILTSTEASLILPVLCDKSGQNNAAFRTMIRSIIHNFCKVHPADKVFNTVMLGINSKNARSKVECIEEVGCLIKDYGIELAQPKDVKFIAKQINSADNNVRAASVNTLAEVFKEFGEKTWEMIGDMPDKAKGILEQRFKLNKPKEPEKPAENKKNSKKQEPKKNLDLEPDSKKTREFRKSIEPKPNPEKNTANDGKKKRENSEVVGIGVSRNLFQHKNSEMEKITEKLIGLEKDIVKFNEFEHVEVKKVIDSIGIPYSPKDRRVITPNAQRFQDPRTRPNGPLSPYFLENNKEESKNPNETKNKKFFRQNSVEEHLEGFHTEPKALNKVDVARIVGQLSMPDTSQQLKALEALTDVIFEDVDLYGADLVSNSSPLSHAIIFITPAVLTSGHVPASFRVFFFKSVLKVCSAKCVVECWNELELYHVYEEFLKILAQDSDKTGADNETEETIKCLNGSIIKLLELSQFNSMFTVLLRLLTKYKSSPIHKIPGILSKCILKLTKNISNKIEELNLERIILTIHDYLGTDATENDELGVKTMKTIVNELVKSLGEDVLALYTCVQNHSIEDKHIGKWIEIFLQAMAPEPPMPAILPSQKDPFIEIIERLSYSDTYNQGILELLNYSETHPGADIPSQLSSFPDTFKQKIIQDLLEAKNKKSVTTSYNFSDMQSRIAVMKQKFGLANEHPSHNDLNTKVNSLADKLEETKLALLKTKIQSFGK